jgi:hypothetical protein
MGYAARAKERRGNPTPNPLMMRYITQDAFKDAVRRGQQFRATYSDRAYVMDKHGTLRRLPPSVERGGGSKSLQPGRPETVPRVHARAVSK